MSQISKNTHFSEAKNLIYPEHQYLFIKTENWIKQFPERISKKLKR